MCSPGTFRVTFSVVCNDSFLSQNAFPFRWWVNVSFAFPIVLLLLLCCAPCCCLMFSSWWLSYFFRRIFFRHWSMVSAGKKFFWKNSISTQRTKIHRKPKNKQTSERTAYYEGTGERPKAGKRQGEPKQKKIIFNSFPSFEQLSTHFVVLCENFR